MLQPLSETGDKPLIIYYIMFLVTYCTPACRVLEDRQIMSNVSFIFSCQMIVLLALSSLCAQNDCLINWFCMYMYVALDLIVSCILLHVHVQ